MAVVRRRHNSCVELSLSWSPKGHSRGGEAWANRRKCVRGAGRRFAVDKGGTGKAKTTKEEGPPSRHRMSDLGQSGPHHARFLMGEVECGKGDPSQGRGTANSARARINPSISRVVRFQSGVFSLLQRGRAEEVHTGGQRPASGFLRELCHLVAKKTGRRHIHHQGRRAGVRTVRDWGGGRDRTASGRCAVKAWEVGTCGPRPKGTACGVRGMVKRGPIRGPRSLG